MGSPYISVVNFQKKIHSYHEVRRHEKQRYCCMMSFVVRGYFLKNDVMLGDVMWGDVMNSDVLSFIRANIMIVISSRPLFTSMQISYSLSSLYKDIEIEISLSL